MMQIKKIKILFALAVFFATLLISILTWRNLESTAEEILKNHLVQLNEKLNLDFSFDRLELGLGVATLHGVTFGEDAGIEIEKIKVEADISLLDPQILNPEVVHLIGPTVRTTVKKLKALEQNPIVKKIIDRLLASPNEAEISEKSEFRWPVPRRVKISGASIIVTDEKNIEKVSITGLRGTLNKFAKKATFGFEQLILDGEIEKNVSGHLKLIDKSGLYEFSVNRQKSSENLGWKLAGDISSDFSNINLKIDFSSIPSLLHSTVTRFLSTPEQSGTKGTIEISTTDKFHWNIRSNLNFDHLYLQHASLGKESIGPVAFSLATEMTYAQSNRQVLVTNGVIGIPGSSGFIDRRTEANADLVLVAFSASGLLPKNRADSSIWQAKVRVAPTPCQSALDVLPVQLAPHLKQFEMSGKFGANFDVRINPNSAEDFSYKTFNPLFSCKIAKAPIQYSATQLTNPFTLERRSSKGLNIVEIPLLPNARTFTPIGNMGKNAVLAIVSAEDAGFYSHNGVEWSAMEQALRRNLNEKRIAIGGSTITMQTVKNLVLTNERTFGRKFQELFLSWHLDQEISKNRILEIYLNIVEFGPDIFGITTASRHFFNKHPADLSIKEATYLASVMPAPVTRYRYFCLGRTSPNYDELLHTLLRRMHSLGRISFDEYIGALNEPLIFNPTTRLATNDCHGIKQIALESVLNDSVGE